MPRYMIERKIADLGSLSDQQLQAISRKSCDVVHEMDLPYQWIESFVTDDTMYCIHIAPSEEAVREHSRRGGFPVDRVMQIKGKIDPATAE